MRGMTTINWAKENTKVFTNSPIPIFSTFAKNVFAHELHLHPDFDVDPDSTMILFTRGSFTAVTQELVYFSLGRKGQRGHGSTNKKSKYHPIT